MNKSESIGKLAKALSLAQAEMRGATKDATNPFFKSQYADLQSVCEAIKEAFVKHGLSYAQPMGFNDQGAPVVETILMHESNEWISGETLILAKDSSAQAQGSGITYARRYALAALVGVYQSDDDGESAQPKQSPSIAFKDIANEPEDKYYITEPQWNRFKVIVQKYGWNSVLAEEYYRNTMKGTGPLRAMTANEYKAICEYIQMHGRKQ